MRKIIAGMLVLAAVACSGGDADDAAANPDTLDTSAPPVAVVGMLDPETATREQLLGVPGMTEESADAIIAARPIENMLEVDGLLPAAMDSTARDAVYATLWKPLDLNNASGDEILLIPNVGERMKHEFEEYRPYIDIAQFRREMAKYVDDAEVARLEKYVMIRNP